MLFALGLVFPVAGHAAPTEFDACLVDGGGLACIIIHPTYGGSAACQDGTFIPWLQFVGPLVWSPLTYAGPITIEAQVFGSFDTQLPLYIEVVPVTDLRYLCTLPGYVVASVYAGGNETDRCGRWVTVGPVDISSIVPLGSLYAIRYRAFSLAPRLSSPRVNCLRVTASATGGHTPVVERSWSRVKTLFR
jgi:hypothetical protein